MVYDISPKALGPTRGLSAVLGRNALEKAGRLQSGDADLLILNPMKVKSVVDQPETTLTLICTHGTLSNLGGLFTERSLEVCDETGPHECLGDYAA